MTTKTLPTAPAPQWVRDLTNPPTATTSVARKSAAIADPPGFSTSVSTPHPSSNKPSSKSSANKQLAAAQQAPAVSSTRRKQPTPAEMDVLKLKKAWEVAFAPAKQLPMNAIGMYMSGNSLQIFSIMMVFMLFKGPILAILNINQPFQRLETDGNRGQMILVKIVFVLANVLALGLGTWKLNAMGLLPTTRSDWLAWETAREPALRAYYVPS